MNHALIKSFHDEKSAFSFCINNLGASSSNIAVMVDTYNFKKGLNNFISEMKTSGLDAKVKCAVAIDSGDLNKLSKYTRKKLDSAGLNEVTIAVYGNIAMRKKLPVLDEALLIDATNSIILFPFYIFQTR